MHPKEKIIIQKLLKIANNQQKILQKLAQQQDINVEYLRRAAQESASNTGFAPTFVDVTKTQGSQSPAPGSNSMITVEPVYVVTIHGSPKENNMRQKYVNTFKAQVRTQKPELEKNLSIMLEN